MYYAIHSMKNQGFSKRQIAEKRQLDFRTVSKYLAMTPEEFEESVLKPFVSANVVMRSAKSPVLP